MKVLLISLTFLVFLASRVCSLSSKVQLRDEDLENKKEFTPIIEGRIVGGSEAAANQFPYQAALFPHTLGGKIFCGGSIISAYHLISAAHCFFE